MPVTFIGNTSLTQNPFRYSLSSDKSFGTKKYAGATGEISFAVASVFSSSQ